MNLLNNNVSQGLLLDTTKDSDSIGTNYVFVIAQGRSGSTLLLRILNSIDGYNICGENYGATKFLSQFYKSIIETYETTPKDDGNFLSYNEISSMEQTKKHLSGFEFYNVFQLSVIEDQLRSLILKMLNPEGQFKVCGFKEIRFGSDGVSQKFWKFKVELDFLKKMFPTSKFIFLTRDIEQVVKSSWWAKNPDRSRTILKRQKDCFDKYALQYPDFTFSIRYSDLLSSTSRLQEMYDFLGEDFDLNTYNQIMSRR